MKIDFTWVRAGYRSALTSLLICTLSVSGVFAQCLTPELAMLNSCIEHPNPNGSGLLVESELLVLRSGLAEIGVSDIGFNLPFNGFGGSNADIGFDNDGTFLGCNLKTPTVTRLPGCPNALPLGPGDVIPPNSLVVLFINGITTSADVMMTDFSNMCADGQEVYILQNECDRTAGAFANGPGSGNPRRVTTTFSPCGSSTFEYNTDNIDPNEGTYYLIGPNVVGNFNCDLPSIPNSCPPLDTVFSICGAGAMIDPPVSTDIFKEVYPPSILLVSFHRTALEAETRTNPLDTYGGPTDAPDTLWARTIYGMNLCTAVGRLIVKFPDGGARTMPPTEPLRGCDPTGSGTGTFNLRLFDAEIGGGEPVTYYRDAGTTDVIDDPVSFRTMADTVFAAAGLRNCRGNTVPVRLELTDGPSTTPTTVATSCPENEDGSITLTTTGFGPFSYDWRTSEFDRLTVLTGLSPRQYRVTITDRYGCREERRPRILRGPPLRISCLITREASAANATDGQVRVNFPNGTPPYKLTISGAAAGTMDVDEAMVDLANLAPGAYTFSATDANGCVSDPCELTVVGSGCSLNVFAVIDSVSCGNNGNGSILLSPSGGDGNYTFEWADPAFANGPMAMISTAGAYPVTIFDGAGCSIDTVFRVGVIDNAPRLVLESPIGDDVCSPDSVGLPFTVSGEPPLSIGYRLTYATDGIQTTREIVARGETDTIWIEFNDDSGPGTRLVIDQVRDANCAVSLADTFNIVVPQPDTVRRNEVVCRSGTVLIGGRMFTAASPSDTFLVTDGNTCDLRYEVDLTFDDNSFNPDTVIVFSCPATPYELNGEVFDANRPEGEVVFTRPGRCDSIVFIRLDIPETNPGSFRGNACMGDTIFYQDRFFTADSTGGIVILPGRAANGCDSLVMVTTSFSRTGEVGLSGDFQICPGDSVDLRFTYDGPGDIDAMLADDLGNVTDVGSIGDGTRFTIFPVQSSAYRLISAEAGGCPGTLVGTATVDVSDLALSAEILVDPGEFCRDTIGSALAAISGRGEPVSITWSNGSLEAINPNLLAGTYGVTVTDDRGCMVSDSVTINPQFPLFARLTGVAPACPGEPGRLRIDTIFGGGGFYEISVDGEFFLPIGDANRLDLEAGRPYRARIQDVEDCRISVPFFVPFTDAAVANLPLDTLIELGDSLLLAPVITGAMIDSVWWTYAPGLRDAASLTTVVMPLRSTVYTLNVITSTGCVIARSVNVTVDERLPVYAPSAFSPNGDNVNEVYTLGVSERVEAVRTFRIFNRWGTMVHDGLDGWDGMLNGRPAEAAVYIYRAVLLLADGSERSVEGDFVLMR